MPWSEGILVTEKAMCLLLVLGAEKAKGFPCGSVGKESTCNVGDLGSIPGLGRSPRIRKCYLIQYSGMENSISLCGHKESDMTEKLSLSFCTTVKRG